MIRAGYSRKAVLFGIAAVIGSLLPRLALAVFPDEASNPSAGATVESRPDTRVVEVPPASDKAMRYYRSGNVIWSVEQTLGLLLPALLLFTGLSARMRTLAEDVGRGHFYPTLLVYLALFSLVMFVVQLPLDYYVSFVREHAYGLSSQKLSKWIGDQLKGLGVGFVVGALVLWVPYWLLGKSPQHWWLWTGMLALPFYMLTLFVVPLWVAPLFNKFGPMQDKALEAEVLATAQKAGVEGARVFEVEKSVDTNKVNAYVTGIGGTKRIVLWDTLLTKLKPAQTKFVVGHELGHYVLGHIWTSILVSAVLTILGLFGAHRLSTFLFAHAGARMGFDRLADVASLPLLMLLLSLFSLAITPAMLAFSRYHEHQADKFGLDLTRDNHAAATAFVELQQQNLSNPRPGPLFKLFRASHPPIGERVDFINAYHPWR
jgi:STE24 endopeptidase